MIGSFKILLAVNWPNEYCRPMAMAVIYLSFVYDLTLFPRYFEVANSARYINKLEHGERLARWQACHTSITHQSGVNMAWVGMLT